jgi:GT2 family glycosyltransferase
MNGAPKDDPREVASALREEVESLGRIVDEQERALVRLQHELLLHSSALGWRLQRRLEGFRAVMLRVPILRQIYRALYRALEIWTDEGAAMILVRAGHKMGLALRGRDFRVEARSRRPRSFEEEYQDWIRRDGSGPGRDAIRSAIAQWPSTPLVSVLAAVQTADADVVRRLLDTLRAQAYEHWELCLAVSSGARAALSGNLAAARAGEPRLRVADGKTNDPSAGDALSVASGEFIGVLDADDTLAPEALFHLLDRLNEEPTADIVYSDEDWLDGEGQRQDPFFKPDWSPDLLLSTNYVEHVAIFRRRLVDEVGAFRVAAGRAQVYDLVLRLSEASDRIAHVPRVLCHRRRRPTTVDAILERRAASRDECRVLDQALGRRGRPGRVSPVFARRGARCYSTRFDLREQPLVSIIIPTRNKRQLLETTIESILQQTDYDRYEILVVDNASNESDAVEYLASLPPKCQVHRWNERFNYSAINNFGAQQARGEQLLFLNNDVEVIRPDWLTAMLEHAQRPDVGAVGAKLLYADGRIQHAGVVVGINRAAANAFRGWPGDTIGSPRLADLTRNCSAVTGACMMVPRQVFEKAGGFDERLRVVLNDVDLCLKIRQLGYLVVYTPHALLYHYEGSSRGLLHPPPDQAVFEERWSSVLAHCDPYYSPNLTDNRDDWSLRSEDLDK